MSLEALPEYVQDRIHRINQKTGIDLDEILRSYYEIFNSDFVQKDPQFKTDDERHRYSVAVLWSMYIARRPAREYVVIPIGFEAKRITRRSGVPSSSIYALVKGRKGIQRIVCQGEGIADLYKSVNLFCQYRVKLCEFSGGDLQADNRTKFVNPVRLKIEPRTLMEKIGIKRIPRIADVPKFPSAVRSDGFVDRRDWRVVRGIIVRSFRGTRDDGTEFGVYTISDDSVSEEELTDEEGVPLTGLTVWAPPELMVYEQYDECDFYGHVSIGKNGVPDMNAYLILPVHARGRLEI